MPSFDVKVTDESGREFTVQVDNVKTQAEAQAHVEQIAGVKMNEPKVEDPPFVPEWQRSTIPAAPEPTTPEQE